ncbi:hypothetical protein BU14_1453s0002 [Porphyra umbilicalis]|uniref:Uncharacterized protein n=1 Tax=Porphyra umbilicalis TaxID=2786 RepID=A0A1X6NLL6_PORUM|nr:hypothetical protein BU14_1453s0002 [Porphyra umbilicalis]|eukprot:OSX69504.1 hypothetical protein BU14_1453s0002 [Porphyra umbilicalis]
MPSPTCALPAWSASTPRCSSLARRRPRPSTPWVTGARQRRSPPPNRRCVTRCRPRSGHLRRSSPTKTPSRSSWPPAGWCSPTTCPTRRRSRRSSRRSSNPSRVTAPRRRRRRRCRATKRRCCRGWPAARLQGGAVAAVAAAAVLRRPPTATCAPWRRTRATQSCSTSSWTWPARQPCGTLGGGRRSRPARSSARARATAGRRRSSLPTCPNSSRASFCTRTTPPRRWRRR